LSKGAAGSAQPISVVHGGGLVAVVALAHAGGDRSGWVGRAPRSQARAFFALLLLGSALADCSVGPDYVPEAAPTAKTFKELKGWKVATPSDQLDRGDWWGLYHDPKLSTLIKQVEISNQNVAAQAAAYEQARATIREAQAQLFPVISATYNASRSYSGPNAGSASQLVTGAPLGKYSSTYTPGFSGTWDLDVWGQVRRQIESNASSAQVNAADLANVKLSQQALLATAYFNMRASDSLYDLLVRTAQQYQKTLDIVRNQFKAGYSVTSGDVATAEAQLFTAQAQAHNAALQRAQYEHAIAMLIGRPPDELTIAPHLLGGSIPRIPVAVPSALLERRPDVAAAERAMQQQNALIGVAVAGYFPQISLSALFQWTSGAKPLPFNVTNEVWSLGAAGTQVLFDGGLHGAEVDAARATYWQAVATYRQTVLTALQGVEDQLVAIHQLTQALALQQRAVKDAQTAVDVYLNQFQAGTVAFTTVVTAEITLLADQETELTYRQDLFLASVTLIEDLGGGWDTNLLPTKKELEQDISLLPQLPPNEPTLRLMWPFGDANH
jgi:NodT family efflux transporter outer membrane factor (OMF) lipoprotein